MPRSPFPYTYTRSREIVAVFSKICLKLLEVGDEEVFFDSWNCLNSRTIVKSEDVKPAGFFLALAGNWLGNFKFSLT